MATPAPIPARPQSRLRLDWISQHPNGVLPHDYDAATHPGPPKQQFAGFFLSAQISDAPSPLGQPSPPPAGRLPQMGIMLTAVKAQPEVKGVSWELDQNGLTFDGTPERGIHISTAGFRSQVRSGQIASIIQSLPIRGRQFPKRVIIYGLLRQAEDDEETLTFRTPTMGTKEADQTQLQKTPSGVAVSLPPRALSGASDRGPGTSSVLLLSFQMVPSQTPASLPNSTLFQKYHRPILLRVGAMTPRGASYDYPFSDPASVMSLYKEPGQAWQYGPRPDVLTLAVQQRVYVREVPFAISVPVSHRPIILDGLRGR